MSASYKELEEVCQGYKEDISSLKKRIIELESLYTNLEIESKQIIDAWSKERERILEEN